MPAYTYDECVQLCKRNSRKKLDHNTYLTYNKWDDEFEIALHGWCIIRVCKDRWILSACGWRTVTTKDRLNKFAPIRLYQKKFQWYIADDNGIHHEFQDGMSVNAKGEPIEGEPID
jgi:hypothetical protein